MFKVILVGTDGSAGATDAVKTAAALAAELGASLHVVSSYKPQHMRVTGAGSRVEVEAWDVDSSDRAAAVLSDARDIVRHHAIEVVSHQKTGDPAKAIARVAKEVGADLIVIGNKGMKGVKRLVLGSVPNDVAHSAHCAVLILKTS